MRPFLILLFLSVMTPKSHALDRVQLVQSRIHASISSILSPTDFLVVVNRLDTLDDGGAAQVVEAMFETYQD